MPGTYDETFLLVVGIGGFFLFVYVIYLLKLFAQMLVNLFIVIGRTRSKYLVRTAANRKEMANAAQLAEWRKKWAN